MPNTFVTAYTRLMGQVDRPLTELDVLAEAKAAINDTILQLQRRHAYRFTERLFDFVYPANTLHANLQNICSGILRDILSIQLISSEAATGGPILEYKSYNQIQVLRRKFQRTHPNSSLSEEYSFVDQEIAHETGVRRLNGYYVFRMGEHIGLYPTPTADVRLLMNAHIWLMPLVEDDDTNFFLDYAYDLVITLALKRMNVYMKSDNRFMMTQNEIELMIETLVAFDGQVHESTITTLA